jgi:hypothetical protein
MGLFDRVKEKVSSRAWPGAAEWIPAARVAPPPQPAPSPFVVDATYLRVWLAEAHLSHSRSWFTEWHPLVHAAVARSYGNRTEEQVAMVSPGSIPGFDGAAAASVTLNKPLTPLLPFPGGTVSLNVGLVAVKGDNTIRQLIDVVGGFGGLITSIPLSTGTAIATQVVNAFEALFGLGDNVGTLAYDSTFALDGGAAVALAPGYLAVLDQAVAPGTLWVRNGQLIAWSGQGPSATVPGSYLLLRLESRVDRDDWRHLGEIEEPLLAARRAADADTRRVHYQRAIVAARTSPDLHEADRIRIAVELRGLRDADSGFGAVADLPQDLASLAAAATLTPEDALTSRPSLPSLLAG